MVPAMSRPSNSMNWLWSAISALLLLVVAAHAVEPLRADHQRVRGSAFSASTEEVSLGAPTRTAVVKKLVPLEPVLPVEPVAAVHAERAAAVRQALPAAGRAAAPATDPALHPLSPRAPPLA
jgi:hypothetical protein